MNFSYIAKGTKISITQIMHESQIEILYDAIVDTGCTAEARDFSTKLRVSGNTEQLKSFEDNLFADQSGI